jgi:hypothetical protein
MGGVLLMEQSPGTNPTRPVLALRVGVTGSRHLRTEQLAGLEKQAGEVLALVQREVQSLAHDKMVAPFYAHDGGAAPVPTFRIVSPLATGADRLVAKAAKHLGYELFVPMPFNQKEYEKDFDGRGPGNPEPDPKAAAKDLKQFLEVLDLKSGQIELDGEHDPNPETKIDSVANYAYEFAGRFMVRHCDLLIAIWDGKPGHGRGGTAEVIRYATVVGVPVWWVHATDPKSEPVFLRDLQDLRDSTPSPAAAESELRAHLRLLISVPRPKPGDHHNWIRRMISRIFPRRADLPITTFFAEVPRKRRLIWRTYSTLMRLVSGVNPPWTPPIRPEDPVPRYWFDRYQPADERAWDYASRYRSSYVLIISFATLALIFGALALGFTAGSSRAFLAANLAATWMAGIELVFLGLILAIVTFSQRRAWHERSIEYRLLAELFRKQQTLGALGWSLSLGNVQHMADAEGQSWVGWLFAATQRAAPMLDRNLTCAGQRESNLKALNDLIEEQLEYHKGRNEMARKAGTNLENLGSFVFLFLLVCVILKLFSEAADANYFVILVISLFATILPGVSAAFVGIRSYAELQLLAEQSHHMIAELEGARERIGRLNLERALVSQDLGAEGLAVATMMLQDLEGWGRLFRGKATEAG